jgi:hypothetical protein
MLYLFTKKMNKYQYKLLKPPLTLLMLAFSLQISPSNGTLLINLLLNVSLPSLEIILLHIINKNARLRYIVYSSNKSLSAFLSNGTSELLHTL